MDERWRAKDYLLIFGIAAIVVLLFAQMVQSDRFYDRYNKVIDGLGRQSEKTDQLESRVASLVTALEDWQPGIAISPGAGAVGTSKRTKRPSTNRPEGWVAGDWLVRRLPSQPEGLNPLLANDAYQSLINSYIYERLIRHDKNEPEEYVPELATHWEVSDDKLDYTFHLDPRARWQDGEPVTAEDVVFSYQTIVDPNVNNPHLKVYFKDIQEVVALDDHTVRIRYDKPYWTVMNQLLDLQVLPKHIFEYEDAEDFTNNKHSRAPLGSGPYKFVEWRTGDSIVLERWEDYWKIEDRAAIERILFRIYSNEPAAFQALLAGDINYMGLTPDQWVERASSEEFEAKFRKMQWPVNGYSYIGWNIKRPFFSDKRVRQAMTMLTPRELILEKVYHGLADIVTGNFHRRTGAYNPDIEPWPFDPSRAVQLLEEAGWKINPETNLREKDGQPFRFTLTVPSGSTAAERMAVLIQNELAKVNIDMSVNPLEFATLLERIDKREFDAATLSWSIPYAADPYQLWHSSQVEPPGNNYTGFSTPEMDEIIEKAREEFDTEARNQMFHRFHEILHENQPYTFLFNPLALAVVDRRFENVQLYAVGDGDRPGVRITEWFTPTEKQKH